MQLSGGKTQTGRAYQPGFDKIGQVGVSLLMVELRQAESLGDWGLMYNLLLPLSKRVVLAQSKYYRLHLSPSRYHQIAHDITTAQIERYLKSPTFRSFNFKTCLIHRFREVVFNRSDVKYESKRISFELFPVGSL